MQLLCSHDRSDILQDKDTLISLLGEEAVHGVDFRSQGMMLQIMMHMMLWTGPTPYSQVTSAYLILTSLRWRIASFPKQEVTQSLFTIVWIHDTLFGTEYVYLTAFDYLKENKC